MELKKTITSFIASAALVVAVGAGRAAFAAEQAPNEPDAKTKALEERVKQLEKRLAEIEANEGKGFTNAPLGGPGFQQDDFNKLFEQMRRQMMENGGRFGLNAPGMPPNMGPNFGLGLGGPGMRNMGHKPALGVGVDELSEELKTRFKNNIKEGAFVLSVYPGSAAEKAGITVGDAITSFDDKPITGPKALIDAVKGANKGTHSIMLARHGELLKVNVDLEPHAVAQIENDENEFFNGGPAIGGNMKARTELHVSSLEMTDDLAKNLNLNDAQRTKMSGILATHAKALSDEISKGQPAASGFAFTLNGDIAEKAKQHGDLAAKDLAGVLNAEQLKKWNDYRNSNSSISFSQSIQRGNFDQKSSVQDEPTETIKF